MTTLPLVNTIVMYVAAGLSISFMLLSLVLIVTNSSLIVVFEFYKSLSSTFEFPVMVDYMSTMFFSLVLLISSAVVNWSSSYMFHDYLNKRFTIMVVLFVTSMMFLIFALNTVAIILGWDGLGLTSFILVAYYSNKKTNSASMVTALSNRLGDSAILVAIALSVETSTWNFMQTPVSMHNWFMMLFIIVAALTKSAQMPFSAWLPAAMAAPTPVSALVHSSTLVTAGIYLLIRFNPVLLTLDMNSPLLFIGILTSIMASIAGCLESNLKKVVALSTLSQLGLMMATLSLGLNELAFFHLVTHAIFKALLFISCGKMIHDSASSQDVRLMGALMSKTPFTWISLNTSNFALCGVPYLAGFYSKDLIYETALNGFDQISVMITFSIAIMMSTIYSVRMMFCSMVNFNLSAPLFNSLDIDSKTMLSMKMLITPAIVGGSALSWLLFPVPHLIMLPFTLKILPSVLLILCFMLGLSFSALNWGVPLSTYIEPFMQMWYLPSLTSFPASITFLVTKPVKLLDYGWFEFMFAQGYFSAFTYYSSNITKSQMHQTSTFLVLFTSVVVVLLMVCTQSS